MPKYDYIRLTLSEMVAGEPHIIYNYPQAESPDPEAVFDGTAAIREFLNLKECYVLWSSTKGHFFSLITPNPTSTTGAAIVITMLLDNECALAGRRTVAVLNELKKTLVEERILTDDAVDHALEMAALTPEPEKLKSWQYEKPLTSASAPTRPLCYRTYASSSELDAILSFPTQVEYACFDRVLAVQATASLRPGSRLDRITARLKREYTVIAPVGCTPSRTVVTDGERLTLTFTKAGFNPRQENISVGAPSPYVRYDGPAIRVKTAAESGMGFVRRVPLRVSSAKGIPVNGFTINVNGHPINTMEPYIEITERDLSPSAKTEIHVASNNYKPLKVVKTPAELIDSDAIELVLEPIEQGITLRLDFGEGRIFQQEITLEKNTPEYSQLHSGNFHGFRAHRLTVASNAEVYNVDMKSPVNRSPRVEALPQEPAEAPVAPDIPRAASAIDTPVEQRRPVAPVFDKVTPETRRQRKQREREAREEERRRARSAATAEAPATQGEAADAPKSSRGVIFAVIAAVAIVAALACWFFIPGIPGESVPEAEVVEAASEAPAQAETAAPAAVSPEEKADIEYLNDNTRTWKAQELKSDTYRALIDAMAEGDTDAIFAHPYFTDDKALTNNIARQIADMLWAAKGSPNWASNVKAVKRNVKDGTVQVWDMYEAVARVKPTEENRNKTPRPVK